MFYSISRSPDELSIVCEQHLVPPRTHCERDWRATRVLGPLDMSLIGVLESLARPLTRARVSIFTLSTYETDYLLVRKSNMKRAIAALKEAGHRFETEAATEEAPAPEPAVELDARDEEATPETEQAAPVEERETPVEPHETPHELSPPAEPPAAEAGPRPPEGPKALSELFATGREEPPPAVAFEVGLDEPELAGEEAVIGPEAVEPELAEARESDVSDLSDLSDEAAEPESAELDEPARDEAPERPATKKAPTPAACSPAPSPSIRWSSPKAVSRPSGSARSFWRRCASWDSSIRLRSRPRSSPGPSKART